MTAGSSLSGWTDNAILSVSIAFYRPQAEVFGGRSDGKFGVPSAEVSLIQVLISAGDN
jgi:hypothetical protein